jgi:hypothetical protein
MAKTEKKETTPAKLSDIEKDKVTITNIGSQKAELYLGGTLFILKSNDKVVIPAVYLHDAIVHPHVIQVTEEKKVAEEQTENK